MVVIDRWSLYRNTVNNDDLIKWSLCTGFLKSACQIRRENYLGQNQPFTTFVEGANNLTKLVEKGKHFLKFIKFVNNFTKFGRICQQLCEVRRICQQLYKVRGTHKQHLWSLWKLRTTLQSSWDSPRTFGKSAKPAKTLWSL